MAYSDAELGGTASAPGTLERRQLTFSDVALMLFYSSTVAIAMGGWI
jgi:hypothetical protein